MGALRGAEGLLASGRDFWQISQGLNETMEKPWENHGKTMGKPSIYSVSW